MTEKARRGKYRIISANRIASDITELRINAPEIADRAAPGQFVNVYLPGGELLLPRPIGIADARDDTITLVFAVVGKGTKALSRFEEGQHIELMGPLGTGFFDYPGSPADDSGTQEDRSPGTGFFDYPGSPADDSGTQEDRSKLHAEEGRPFEVLLIGGGTGVPPLYYAARELERIHGNLVRRTACLGFPAEPWYTNGFGRVCNNVLIGSETEGAAEFHGNVIELLDTVYPLPQTKEGIQIKTYTALALACGPRPMLAAAAKWCEARDIPLRVSLEERMGCGYGACAGCTVDTRPLNDAGRPQNGPIIPDANGIIRKKVCVHGPVFWADEVAW